MTSIHKFCLSLILSLVGANLFAGELLAEFSRLPVYKSPPDPLVTLDGRRISTAKEWFENRRPELKRLFEHYEYGTMPPPLNFNATVEHGKQDFFNGKATGEEVTLSFGPATNAPKIHLLLIIPKKANAVRADAAGRSAGAEKLAASALNTARRGVPIFVGMNFCGNFTLVTNQEVGLPQGWLGKNCPGCVDNRATSAGRGTQLDVWAIEQTIDRGYALATFYCGDVEPDTTNATSGIRAFLGYGSSQAPPKDCGVIAAWAWGLSRAIDYLNTREEIDTKRIAVVGHSRLGKAAVVAAAFDERIALAVPLQSGTGGTAPSRSKTGESVKAINDKFPHWFNDEFKKFNTDPSLLPVDQNCLMAMIAPRAILIGCATEDVWSNPPGQFEMLKGADAVYRLTCGEGLEATEMPEVNKLVSSRLGYFIRPGKHSMTKGDWKVFLDYADKIMP